MWREGIQTDRSGEGWVSIAISKSRKMQYPQPPSGEIHWLGRERSPYIIEEAQLPYDFPLRSLALVCTSTGCGHDIPGMFILAI
jgi:hypothetical protein